MPEPIQSEGQQPVVPQPVAQPQQPAAQVPPAPQVPVATPAPVVQPLPQDTRDRTREQFEKLLDSNRRMYEEKESYKKELEQRRAAEQTFAPVQQVPPTSQQLNPADFVVVDPVTGESYIDNNKMAAKFTEINQRATRAEQAVQSYIKTSEEREIDRQSKEAYNAYPDLNPYDKDKFNPAFNKQVRGVLLDSMYNPDEYGGKPLSFKEAADFAKSTKAQPSTVTPPAPTDAEVKKKAEAAAVAAKQLKEQGATNVPSQPQNPPQPTTDEEIERLRFRTRRGDDEALAKRIMHTEHIVPKGTQT